jgi:hypothetical protein
MALFIDTSQSTEGVVFQALIEMAQCDPGLTFHTGSDDIQVNYTQKNPGVTSSNRLLEVVNSVEGVVIIGVTDAYVTEDGHEIAEFGGLTYTGNPGALTYIYIDVTDAAGQHYLCLDTNGNTIWGPLPVVLYHELAHFYHARVKMDAPADHTDDQTLAIADENAFRAQLGLPQRFPFVGTGKALIGTPARGGVTFPACKPPANSASLADLFDGTCVGCNIATAALGSPVAREIVAFRRAKREFASLTLGSVPLLEPMMDSYQLFSPLIAADMGGDPVLRDAMLRYGVLPAVYLLRVVQAYVSGSIDDQQTMIGVKRALDDYVAAVIPTNPAPSLAAASQAALTASRALAAVETEPSTGPPSGHRFP